MGKAVQARIMNSSDVRYVSSKEFSDKRILKIMYMTHIWFIASYNFLKGLDGSLSIEVQTRAMVAK